MKKKIIFSLLIITSFNLFIVPVLAQENTTGGQNNPGNTTGGQNNPGQTGQTQSIKFSFPNPFSRAGDDLFEVMETIVKQIIMPIGGVLAVLAFIYSGFKFVTARGNQTKIEEAKRALLYTAIGTAILLGAFVISQVIGNTVNQLMP